MKNLAYIPIVVVIFILSSCSNQRYVSSETDDIYFTPEERYAEVNNEFNQVKEVNGSEYSSEADYQPSGSDDSYFVKGKASPKNDVNPNASNAYATNNQNESQEEYFPESEPSNNGGTVNNFYGSTNYYESDVYDDSYATRIRRFSNVNVGMGYGYYDPFFVDPFWNYGWSYWNPYPYGGWNVGWNSWGGWNVGFGYGYGYGWNRFNRWGYGGGYWGNCWNCFGYNPYWGNNSYWNGYNNGYWNGYSDGIWSSSDNNINNSRGIYNGRRDLATSRGFGNGSRNVNTSPNEQMRSSKLVESSNTSSVGITDRTGSKVNSANDIKSPNRLLADGSKLYQSTPNRANVDNKTQKFETNRAKDINTRSEAAGSKYQPKSGAVSPNQTRAKYDASELNRAESINKRYNTAPRTSPSNPRQQSSPKRQQNVTSPSRDRNVAPSNRNYSTPRDKSPTQQRYYSPNTRNSPTNRSGNSNRNYAPSGSKNNGAVNRSYSTPNRTSPSRNNVRPSSPSRSYSPSPSRSSGRSNYSSPSRGSSPSRSFSRPSGGSSSPSRSFSSPSRSSSPSPRSSGGRR
ncbi:MAG: hypothetical protein WEC59_02465 [Salibacteraceae bacterium]